MQRPEAEDVLPTSELAQEGPPPQEILPPDEQDTADQELLDRFMRGNERAFALLYTRYASQMYNLAARVMPSMKQAEDLLVQTFVDAYYALRHMESVDLPPRVLPWLDRLLATACLNMLNHEPSSVYSWETPDDTSVAPTLGEHIEPDQRAWTALRLLSPRQRFVLALRDWQHLPYTGIEITTGLTHHQVEAVLLTARRHMRAAIYGERPQPDIEECAGALLVQADLDAQLTTENGLWVEAHLRNCSGCRRLLTELRQARDAFYGLPVLLVPTELGKRVQSQIDALRAVLPPRVDTTVPKPSPKDQGAVETGRSPRDTGPLPETLAEREQAGDEQAVMVGAAPPKLPATDENHLVLPAWWKKSYEPRNFVNPRILFACVALVVIALLAILVKSLNLPLSFQSPLSYNTGTVAAAVTPATSTTPQPTGQAVIAPEPQATQTPAPTATAQPSPTATAQPAPPPAAQQNAVALVIMGDDYYGNQQQDQVLPALSANANERVDTMTVADLERYLGSNYAGSLKTIAAAARLAPGAPQSGIKVNNSHVQHVGAAAYAAALIQLGIHDAEFSVTSLQDIQGSAGMLGMLKGIEVWKGRSVTPQEQQVVTQTLEINDTLINAGMAPENAAGVILNITMFAYRDAGHLTTDAQKLNWADSMSTGALESQNISNKQATIETLNRYATFVIQNMPKESGELQPQNLSLEKAQVISKK